MPLVAGEDVRTPLGAFRVIFGIGHFNNQPSASASTLARNRWRFLWLFPPVLRRPSINIREWYRPQART
jgi:hypothetical protein